MGGGEGKINGKPRYLAWNFKKEIAISTLRRGLLHWPACFISKCSGISEAKYRYLQFKLVLKKGVLHFCQSLTFNVLSRLKITMVKNIASTAWVMLLCSKEKRIVDSLRLLLVTRISLGKTGGRKLLKRNCPSHILQISWHLRTFSKTVHSVLESGLFFVNWSQQW